MRTLPEPDVSEEEQEAWPTRGARVWCWEQIKNSSQPLTASAGMRRAEPSDRGRRTGAASLPGPLEYRGEGFVCVARGPVPTVKLI